MKKVTSFLLTLLLLTSSSTVVIAQSPNSSGGQERAQTAQAESQQRSLNNLYEIASRIQTKMIEHMRLYEKFIEKLETRRGKLASAGVNTEQLDSQIRLIKTDTANLRNKIDSLKVLIDNTDYNQNPSTLRNEFRSEFNQIRQQFRQLHSSLTQAVQSLARLSN